MSYRFPKGAKVKIISLQPYDIQFHPELKIGDIGEVVGYNDYIDSIVCVNFNGDQYNMEGDQLEIVIDPEIEPAVKATEKWIGDFYKDVGKALSNMPKKED